MWSQCFRQEWDAADESQSDVWGRIPQDADDHHDVVSSMHVGCLVAICSSLKRSLTERDKRTSNRSSVTMDNVIRWLPTKEMIVAVWMTVGDASCFSWHLTRNVEPT